METVTSNSKIAQVIISKQAKGFVFKPDQELYKAIGINKHRFAKIWRGEKEPLQSELKAIASYFNIDIKELF